MALDDFLCRTVFTAGACGCLRRIIPIPNWARRFSAGVDSLIQSNWAIPLLVVASVPFLKRMKGHAGSVDSTFDFIPSLQVLGFYGICYGYGWLFFRNRSRLKQLRIHANIRMAIGVVAISTYLSMTGWYLKSSKPNWAVWTLVCLSAVAIWSMVEGWLAIFQKHFDRPSPFARYISDSSYWAI